VYDSARTYAVRRVLSEADEPALFKRVYPKYLTSQMDCGGAGDLAAQRASGNFVPRLEGALEGSFTRPGAKQVLYGVFRGECGAIHAENWGTRETIVFEGDVIAHRAIHADARLIDAVDVDGDGIDEIVASSSFFNQGAGTTHGWIFRIDGRKTPRVVDLGEIELDACGSFSPEHVRQHVLVLRQPDGKLEVRAKPESIPCPPREG
jgi:hypothetical protein